MIHNVNRSLINSRDSNGRIWSMQPALIAG
jgi:hypothetical protein